MIKLPVGLQMFIAHLQMIKPWFGKEPLITPKWIAKGRYDWHVTPDKAISELGLKITPLEEGLRRTIEWVKNKQKDLT